MPELQISCDFKVSDLYMGLKDKSVVTPALSTT